MKIGFADRGEILFDRATNSSAYVIEFANGRRIYSLSSNPNALAGKRGHVTLDEFALHPDQRLLYRTAKPVTMWGGQLSIISTHRGVNTLFNQIIRSIKQAQKTNGTPAPISNGARALARSKPDSSVALELSPDAQAVALSPISSLPSPTQPVSFGSQWSLHEVPITKAVDQGIVERINKKTGNRESREQFLARIRGECIDEEQWLREYCCVPSDESAQNHFPSNGDQKALDGTKIPGTGVDKPTATPATSNLAQAETQKLLSALRHLNSSLRDFRSQT
jgi:hypothetical protein